MEGLAASYTTPAMDNGEVIDDGVVAGDGRSFDIFSDAGRVARGAGSGPVDILGGLQPEMLIATGHSQSASRLATYLNSVHPLDPVYDGFMVHGGGGRIRDDQPVRIFKLMAETDMPRRAANPQPDTDWFRHWEVARDEYGNVLGGIRLAAHAVPTARNTGINYGDNRFCILYGSHHPFDEQLLGQLYSGQDSYVSAVRAVVEQNLADGYILPFAAERTIRQAESSSIGR